MPSTFSNNLGLELQATGENPATWGQIANTNFALIDDAVDGVVNVPVTTGATITVSTVDAPVASNGRSKVLTFTGTGPATIIIAPNDAEKWYFVRNETNGVLTFQQGSGSTYTLDAGYSAVIHCDGAGVSAGITGTLSSIQTDKLRVRGPLDITGAVTLGGALNVAGAVTLATTLNVTGAATLSGAVTMSGGATISALSVTGNATVGGTLGVTGLTTLSGGLAALSVTGATQLNGGCVVAGGILHASAGARIDIGSDATGDLYCRAADGTLKRISPPSSPLPFQFALGNSTPTQDFDGTPGWSLTTLLAGAHPIRDYYGTPPYYFPEQNVVLYSEGGQLTVGGLHFNKALATLSVTAPTGDTAFPHLDLNCTHTSLDNGYVSFNSRGVIKWIVGMGGILGDGRPGFYIRRYDQGFSDFQISTVTGRVMVGKVDSDWGGALTIQPHTSSEVPLVIRRRTGQSSHLVIFQDENGNPLAYITSNGTYTKV